MFAESDSDCQRPFLNMTADSVIPCHCQMLITDQLGIHHHGCCLHGTSGKGHFSDEYGVW
jgi:hypothetical protein